MDNNSSLKDLNDIIKFQIHVQLNNVAKDFLSLIEDLEADGYQFADDKRTRIRKKIFDSTGAAKRLLESTMDKFDIKFKIKE